MPTVGIVGYHRWEECFEYESHLVAYEASLCSFLSFSVKKKSLNHYNQMQKALWFKKKKKDLGVKKQQKSLRPIETDVRFSRFNPACSGLASSQLQPPLCSALQGEEGDGRGGFVSSRCRLFKCSFILCFVFTSIPNSITGGEGEVFVCVSLNPVLQEWEHGSIYPSAQ